jgi:hypothetical protein
MADSFGYKNGFTFSYPLQASFYVCIPSATNFEGRDKLFSLTGVWSLVFTVEVNNMVLVETGQNGVYNSVGLLSECTITAPIWHQVFMNITDDSHVKIWLDSVYCGDFAQTITGNAFWIGSMTHYGAASFYIDDCQMGYGISEPVVSSPATWAPTFTSSPQTSHIYLGGSYSYEVTTNESCIFNLSAAPSWASLLVNEVSGMPLAVGLYNFSLKATSVAGTGSAWQNWTANVTDPAPLLATWGPSFTTSPILTSAVNVSWSYSPGLNESGTLALMVYPSWANVTGGMISGTPNATGDFAFNLRGYSTAGGEYRWQNWTTHIEEGLPVGNDTNETGNTTILGITLPAGWYIYLAGVAFIGAVIWAAFRRPVGFVVWVIIFLVALAWWALFHDFAIPPGFLGGIL